MLELWQAERFEKVLTSQPLVLECVGPSPADLVSLQFENNTKRRLFVVKAIGLPEVTQESLFRELFGNLLAREIGIGTPAPALINLAPEFIKAINPFLPNSVHLHAGLSVGCEYFHSGFTNVIPDAYLSEELLAQAALIYAFDLLVQNPDRTRLKPNSAYRASSLVAYDFELSFSFLMLIGQVAEPWEFSKHGIATMHLFRHALRDCKVDWQPFVNAVSSLTRRRLETILKDIPPVMCGQSAQVVEHLLAVKRQYRKLAAELQRSLL
jgi:hypothetical protein